MNLADKRVRAALEDVEARAMASGSAMEWATGRLSFVPVHLLPTVGVRERQALERIAKMATSLGPRAMNVLRNGTIGELNWGQASTAADEALRGLKLAQLADRFHLQGRVSGVMAGHVYIPEGTNTPRIQRLGGYLEPLRDPDDVDYEWGLFQAILVKQQYGREFWRVRVYDLEEQTLYEWDDLRKPYEIARIPEPLRDQQMPRHIILGEDADGLPLGEFMTALPLLKSEWSSQVRADRAEEATAFAQMVIKGEVTGYEQRGPTRVILTDKDGDARYLTPGDLSQLHAHHDRKLERVRQFLNLPGGFLGSQTPSGEALREANVNYMSSCDTYATALSELLTGLVADYFALTNIKDPPQISVTVNREYVKSEVMDQLTSLAEAGLLAKADAIRIVSKFYDEISDAKTEAFIRAQGLEDEQGNPIPLTRSVTDA